MRARSSTVLVTAVVLFTCLGAVSAQAQQAAATQASPQATTAARATAEGVKPAQAKPAGGPFVSIDGEQWTPAHPPVRMDGNVLAAARELFDSLGAATRWDARSHTFTATRDNHILQLKEGDTTYLADGKQHTAGVAPVLVGATLYVPLDAVAQGFHGRLRWDPAAETAELDFTNVPVADVTGTLLQVLAGPPKALVVLDDATSQYRALTLAPSPDVTETQVGGQAVAAKLADLHPGDQVTVGLDKNGLASTVDVQYLRTSGTVQRAQGGTIVLTDGTALRLKANASIVGLEGKPAPADELGRGAVIRARVNPKTGQAGLVTVLAPATPGGAVTIETAGVANFQVFKPGDTVDVRMQGTPAGRASFSVDGFAQGVPMAEVTPGVYEGSYKIPATDNERQAGITCQLVAADQTATYPLPHKITVDGKPPQVTKVSPADGAKVPERRPTISAEYRDDGAGVDLNSVHLFLDGQDVGGALDRSTAGCSYAVPADLAPGQQTVKLSVADKVGNKTTTEWHFDVAPPPGAEKILYVRDDATGSLADGEKLQFEVGTTEPGKQCWITLGDVKIDLARKPNANVYTGSYAVKPTDKLIDVPVVATFVDNAGARHTLAATTKVTLRGDLSAGVTITSPTEKDRITGPFTVAGKARPGATVQVIVTYVKRVLVDFRGELFRGTVTADDKGNWQTTDVDPDVPLIGAPDSYDITAQIANAQGKVTSSAKVTVKR